MTDDYFIKNSMFFSEIQSPMFYDQCLEHSTLFSTPTQLELDSKVLLLVSTEFMKGEGQSSFQKKKRTTNTYLKTYDYF